MSLTLHAPRKPRETAGPLLGSLLLLLSLVIAGCGGSSGSSEHHHRPTPTATATPTPPPGISGTVFGSTGSPISGAQVTAYQTGATGYGTGAFPLARVSTQANGSFQIPMFTCQGEGQAQELYIVATGGTAGGQPNPNPAIALGAGIGNCVNFASSVVINEATTVAMAWTFNQFMDATGQNVGTSPTNQSGLFASSVTLAFNFVDLGTGLAPPSFPDGLTSPTPTLYSLANILAGCVDSSGANSPGCQNLFSAATPPGGTAPTTTLQAALDIARNPANNVNALFALVPASPPFSPGLPAAPASWVAQLNYIPAGAELNSPYALAIDSVGDVWVSSSAGNSISELTSASGYTSSFNFAPSGASLNFPTTLALDTQDNVWVANLNGNSVSELTSASGYSSGNNFAPGTAMFSQPIALALDAAGNVWVGNLATSTVSELLAGCSSASCTGVNFNNSNTGDPGAQFSSPVSLEADVAGNVWVTNYTGNSVSELPAACTSVSCTASNFNGSNTGNPAAAFSGPIELASDALGNVWVANQKNDSLSELLQGCTTASCTAKNFDNTNTGSPGAGFITPSSINLDSSSNVWVTNELGNSVSELAAANGYSTAFNFGSSATFRRQFFIAGDASGNLWIANNYDSSITQVVGVATPVLTPAQACLKSGHNVCLP